MYNLRSIALFVFFTIVWMKKLVFSEDDELYLLVFEFILHNFLFYVSFVQSSTSSIIYFLYDCMNVEISFLRRWWIVFTGIWIHFTQFFILCFLLHDQQKFSRLIAFEHQFSSFLNFLLVVLGNLFSPDFKSCMFQYTFYHIQQFLFILYNSRTWKLSYHKIHK